MTNTSKNLKCLHSLENGFLGPYTEPFIYHASHGVPSLFIGKETPWCHRQSTGGRAQLCHCHAVALPLLPLPRLLLSALTENFLGAGQVLNICCTASGANRILILKPSMFLQYGSKYPHKNLIAQNSRVRTVTPWLAGHFLTLHSWARGGRVPVTPVVNWSLEPKVFFHSLVPRSFVACWWWTELLVMSF